MDLSPTDEQQALVEALHEFALKEVRPAARESEEEGRASVPIVKELFEMGLAAPVPEEFGGQGAFDAVTAVLLAEELAWGDPGIAFEVVWGGAAAALVDAAGTAAQREELLPPLVAAAGSVALAERDAGADVTDLAAGAAPSGDAVRLDGVKYGVVAADAAPVRLVVTAGPEVWIVPGEASLVAVREDKLGLRSARTFKVLLDGTEVPAGARLGGAERSPRLRLGLLRAKLANAGIALGLARAALDYAGAYATQRTAFGRPIGAFQGISFKVADRAMDLDSARLLVWEAARLVDLGSADAERLAMAACGHAVAAAVSCADDAVQILGGHGYMRDHPVEMWYRDAATLATFDSPSMVGDLFLAAAHRGGER